MRLLLFLTLVVRMSVTNPSLFQTQLGAVVDARGRQGLTCYTAHTAHRFATWNVLSMNGPGKRELLDKALIRLDVVVAGLQEVRWKDFGNLNLDNYKMLWSGHTTSATQAVVITVRK